MEDYRIDSNKLMYHPRRVAQWLQEGDCYPIYMEISPSGKCNHRCVFCALEYTEYKGGFLSKERLEELVRELGELGIKAIMYAGEGEPLLHPSISEVITATKKAGIDVSVTTNGSLLDTLVRKGLEHCSWIRVSLDAGTKETHELIHRTKDFNRILDNLGQAVRLRVFSKGAIETTLGVQLLLLRDNCGEVFELASSLRELGIDYLSIKPYSQHPLSEQKVHSEFTQQQLSILREELLKFSADKFRIIFRREGLDRVGKEKAYKECLGLPFFCYVSTSGEVYPCSTFLGNKEYSYGNINNWSFQEIWGGNQRQKVLGNIKAQGLVICRENCRLESINEYLWKLTHPGLVPHINFI